MEKPNISSLLSGLFEQIDANIDATLVLDGKEYEVEHFNINFSQGIDYKGQPQNETRGGQLFVVLTQSVGYNVYDWAKREDKRKDGKILFQSQTRGTVLEIIFSNAVCTKFAKKVSAFAGTKTSLIISPAKVTLNGITHDNRWRE
jgi:hypothetical protein